MVNKKAQGYAIEKLGTILLLAVGLLVLMLIMWLLFSQKLPAIWGSIVDFFRFGMG
jgi:hypothetical protein